MLMRQLINEATIQGIPEMTSDVSRTAQPFYEKFGFKVVEQRFPVIHRGRGSKRSYASPCRLTSRCRVRAAISLGKLNA